VKPARYILFSFVLFIFFFKANAQLLDSLKVIIKSKSSIDLRFESRYSFIDNELADISGIRIGVSFRRKLKFGGGISWLKSDLAETVYIPNENGTLISTPKYLKLAYACVYADFVFYKTKRWQVSVPLQVGAGATWFQYQKGYHPSGTNKRLLLLYEPGISTHFKIFKWFGLGVGVGYRFAIKNNNAISDRLSSPTYALKILFWADQLYYDLFPKSKLAQKRGPSVW
jgi:hypothetical protein